LRLPDARERNSQHRDASRRRVLLDNVVIRRTASRIFLGVIELPASEDDRVEYLEISWHGSSDLHIVDLAVIRP